MRRRFAWPQRERVAERVSAACYGTVLIIAALVVVEVADIASGWGWELVTGVGIATWVAHGYARVLGNHVRSADARRPREVGDALADGLPILIAAVAPAAALLLGRLGVLAPTRALQAAAILAVLQLVALGAFVGFIVDRPASPWRYAAATGVLGVVVVALMVALGH